MRLVRLGLAALIVLLCTSQAPSGYPKHIAVPPLVMTGLGSTESTGPAFTPKKIAIPPLQMTGVDLPKEAVTPPAFTPKKILVPTLTMTGVN